LLNQYTIFILDVMTVPVAFEIVDKRIVLEVWFKAVSLSDLPSPDYLPGPGIRVEISMRKYGYGNTNRALDQFSS
jgi:hypothetical protein